YYNIADILSFGAGSPGNANNPATTSVKFVAFLCLMKFISWSISLGSGTSGGTLAPLFTIGGGMGLVMGWAARKLMPAAGIDPGIRDVVALRSDQTLGEVRAWVASGGPGSGHQGYPLVDENGIVAGVVTRRHLLDPANGDDRRLMVLVQRPPVIVYADSTLRD